MTKLKILVHRYSKVSITKALQKLPSEEKIPNYHIAEPVFFNFSRKRNSIDWAVDTLSPINCGCWQESWKQNWGLLFLWAVALSYVVNQRCCNETCSLIRLEELSFQRCVTVWNSARCFQDYCRLRSFFMVLQMEREQSVWRYI